MSNLILFQPVNARSLCDHHLQVKEIRSHEKYTASCSPAKTNDIATLIMLPSKGHTPLQAGTRAARIEPPSGHRAWTGTRSTCPLPDAGEQPVDEITGLALPEHPGLAEFRLRPFT